MVTPFLKWAGGKRRLLPEIISRFPSEFNQFYEPFVGGGAVFLSLERECTIADINDELINTYKVIKFEVESLLEILKCHKQNHSQEYFYEIRAWDRKPGFKSLPNAVRAARFIYLNKTCFNGLQRVNSQGQNNVPFGKYKNPAIFSESHLREVSDFLQKYNIRIFNGDYQEISPCENDFVYLDPPYAPLNEHSFTAYSHPFGFEDQLRLKRFCDHLTQKNIYWMQSNSNIPWIWDQYRHYVIETVSCNRAINCKGEKRIETDNEVIITNYDKN